MNSRIKEHNDNVIHVNFTPEELSEDYIQEEEEKMFNDFTDYKNRNLIVSVSIVGILISVVVFVCLLGISTLLIFS